MGSESVNLCDYCQKPLTAKRPQARYGSPSHRVLAHRKRKEALTEVKEESANAPQESESVNFKGLATVIAPDTGRGDTPQAPDNSVEVVWQDENLPPILQRGEDSLLRLGVAARSQVGFKLLNEAAEVLLAVINPPLTAFFRERCRALGVKPWQVVAAMIHRSCELRPLISYLNTFGADVLCRNCGHDIPNARLGQLYCCNRCSSYHQGSRVIPFGVHSDECPIIGQPWRR